MSEFKIIPPQAIHEQTFKNIILASALIAFPFVPFRLYVRWRVFKKFFNDDALVVFAYIILLVYAIFLQTRTKDTYIVLNLIAGLAPPDDDFPNHYYRYLQGLIFTHFAYALCLWSIKLAFLLFFKRLGRDVRYQAVIWWTALVWNIITFIVWTGIVNWRCNTAGIKEALALCDNPHAQNFHHTEVKVQMAMDVTSDIAIIIIPFCLLWKVKVSRQKKLALGGIFSLTIFIIIAAISRAAIIMSFKGTFQSWAYPGATIEMAIAIIVACLASFRALFSSKTTPQRVPGHHHNQPNKGSSQHGLIRAGFHPLDRSSTSTPAAARFSKDSTAPSDDDFPLRESSSSAPPPDEESGGEQVSMRQDGKIPEMTTAPAIRGQGFAQREFLVYPAAPDPARIRG